MVFRRSLQRRFVLLGALTASAAFIFLLVRASICPADNGLVSSTETAVRARYGEPTDEFAGHYGLPDAAWTQTIKGEVKSAVFWPLGGRLYVTFEKRNGKWIVICNSYLPWGGVF
jgi:hypothetical protein